MKTKKLSWVMIISGIILLVFAIFLFAPQVIASTIEVQTFYYSSLAISLTLLIGGYANHCIDELDLKNDNLSEKMDIINDMIKKLSNNESTSKK